MRVACKSLAALLIGTQCLGVLGFTPGSKAVTNDVSVAQRTAGSFPGLIQQGRTATSLQAVPAPPRFTSQDWAQNLWTIPSSTILKNIQSHALWNSAWAVVITYMHSQGIIGTLNAMPHQLMATALGLLLVFRTNSAYDRFWEARKVWGAVVNTTRDVVRVSLIAIDDPYLRDRMVQLTMIFPFLLKQHLQNDPDLNEVKAFSTLTSEELSTLVLDANPPLRVCQRMGEVLALNYEDRDDITTFNYRTYLDNEITKLIDFLGMCERIKLTPVPLSYSRHTSRFLTLYMATLPFVLVNIAGNMTPFVVLGMCWGLFSIEEIGHYIEEPFDKKNAQLPLATISGNIQKALAALVDAADPSTVPTEMTPDLLAKELKPLELMMSK